MINHVIAYEGARLSYGLILRDYGPDFVRFANQYGTMPGTRIRTPYLLADFESWIDNLEKGKGRNEVFSILLHDDSGEQRQYRYIGHAGLHAIRYPQSTAVTGSVIGDLNMQGKGYGKEAKLLLQKHAFDVLHLHVLHSEVKAFNAASLGHLLACGYRIYGRRHGNELHEGSRVDTIHLECFRRDWEPIWKTFQESGELPRLTDEQRALVQQETI